MSEINQKSIFPRLEFEEIFSSTGRSRIIKIMATKKELNISKIAELTGLNYNSVKKHLDYLDHLGFIQEKKYGRIRIYRYCVENRYAKVLMNLIEFWDNWSEKSLEY